MASNYVKKGHKKEEIWPLTPEQQARVNEWMTEAERIGATFVRRAPDLREDILQEARAALCLAVLKDSGGADFKLYLWFRVKRHVSRMITSYRRRISRGEQVGFTELDASDAMARDDYDRQQQGRMEVECLTEGLPSRIREIIALRFVADMEREEVASTLGIGVRTVSRLSAEGFKAIETRLAAVPA